MEPVLDLDTLDDISTDAAENTEVVLVTLICASSMAFTLSDEPSEPLCSLELSDPDCCREFVTCGSGRSAACSGVRLVPCELSVILSDSVVLSCDSSVSSDAWPFLMVPSAKAGFDSELLTSESSPV